jgi:O-antigen ligase
MLCAYALGSMAWSHPYLGGVEAVRWFVFSVLVWLGLNTLTRERLAWLAWGVHGGALVASVWAALQFWVGFSLFPQGPNPAPPSSTATSSPSSWSARCPSALLLARARASAQVLLLAASNGFIITAILMTGTRAALMALWLQLLLVWPLLAWRCRAQLAWPQWSRAAAAGAGGDAGTVLVLGSSPAAIPRSWKRSAASMRCSAAPAAPSRSAPRTIRWACAW